MTKAVTLAELADQNVLTALDNKVGIATTNPQSTLQVGIGITMDGNTGVITAQAYHGDGSNLTGIDASSIKDSNGTVRVQANTSGAVVTGVLTATSTNFTDTVVTGVLTATSAAIGNIPGDLSVSGNVSIGGTLTYEDVTNIDSVGIITAQSGIVVSGGATITGVSTFYDSVEVGSGVTVSGTSGITLNEATNASHIINPLLINFAEKVNNLGNIDGGKTIDIADGTYVTATLNQDAPTITLASPPSGKLYGFALQLTNGSGGPYSLTFSGSGTIKWPGGSIPVRTTTDAKTDIWSFFTSDGGSNWYGSISLYNFS
jgi:hypothetical protein